MFLTLVSAGLKIVPWLVALTKRTHGHTAKDKSDGSAVYRKAQLYG